MANSAEAMVVAALGPLVSNGDGTFRCYPDVAPANVVKPYITYQSVGGKSANYLNNTASAQKNARIQIWVWANDRATAINLMAAVIASLEPPPIEATSIGSPVSAWEFDTKLYGSRLDFSIWFPP
ncbi:DUF3168 domain-containing protein [Burkholderia anthina]|uniref:DUF3168 domain-containing protein n=1 Tax=Burkholderia anthina TaxID=179879 RepID=UPI001FC8BA3C|nr:DUF3168 domain-containing protein [Burkholderia anthina]